MNKLPKSISQKARTLFLPGCVKLECHYEPREVVTEANIETFKIDGSDYPRISIIVPSLNQGRFLGQTLKSVTDQGYPNLEIIVVDGGSNDESLDIIQSNKNHIKWWVSEPDNGQASAINKGMARATGDILAWLNSDDCLMPGALFRVAKHFMASADTDVVYGHRVLINDAGLDVGKWILPGHRKFILTYADFIPQETMFWRKAIWQKIGGSLDESFRFALDWELIHRFLKSDAKFNLIPAFLGRFRMHEMQKTNANIATDGLREMEIIRQQCRQGFSKHPALQNFYYRMQRASLYSFVIRARMTELFWWAKLTKID